MFNNTSVEKILAIETSVAEASIALWCGGKMLFCESFQSDRNHNSMLFEPLANALELLEGEVLSMVLVGTGPGSYSGTRVGIAAAQGVALAHGCAAVGLGSMAATPIARASIARETREEKPSLALGDARRGLYFISQIADNGEAMKPELMDAEALGKYLSEHAERALFTLDDPVALTAGLEMGQDKGGGLNLQQRLVHTRPEARLLLDVWMGLDADRQRELARQPLSPTYLRAPFTSKPKVRHPLLRKEP